MRKHLLNVALVLVLTLSMAVPAFSAPVRTPLKALGFVEAMTGNTTNQVPYEIKENDSASHYFKTDKTVKAIWVQVPSYNNNVGTITIKVYKWAGDYGATVKTKPLAEKTYVNFTDRSNLDLYFNGTEGGGEYMIDLSGGKDGVGVFVGQDQTPDQQTFFNGQVIKGGMRAGIKYLDKVELPTVEGATHEVKDAYKLLTAPDADYLHRAQIGNLGAADVEGDITQYILTDGSSTGAGIGCLFGFENLDFGSDGAKGVKVKVLVDANHAHKINVTLDDPMNTPIGTGSYVLETSQSGWYELPIDFSETVTGVHNVYFVTRGDYVALKIKTVQFSKEEVGNTSLEERVERFKQDPAPVYTDTYADTWTLTDMLGRTAPSNEQVGDLNPDKQVGMFYWSWHTSGRTPYNITENLKRKPSLVDNLSDPDWKDNTKVQYVYEESIYGYHTVYDRWAVRKQLELLESAGVDTLIFDATNVGSYTNGALAIMDVMHEMHMEGVDTPKAVYLFPFYNMSYNEWNVQNVYENIYKPGLYSDCWYYWEGKPLVMAYPDNLSNPTGYEDVDALYAEMADFFTFRPGQPNYRGGAYHENQWPWLEVVPLNPYGTSDKYGCEAVAVGVAQNTNDDGLTAMNGVGVYGRSYTYKDKHSKLDESSKLYGYNFQEQWDNAIELDPEFVFVTGWNEYRVQRYTTWGGVSLAFPDTYNDEYSRDAEPVKGDLKDNYYNQLAINIRRFKGARATPLASAEKTIDVSGDFAQWSEVGPEFIGIRGGTEARDSGHGYGNIRYTNNTGRNDIILSKVARDSENIYFYVETAENLTPYTDPDWMRLFINTDRSAISGWEGYDYVINNVNPSDAKAILQKNVDDDWNWENAGEVDYKVQGNKMMIAVPKSLLGLGNSIDIEFKWNDNMQYKGNIMDFYTNGDTAPIGRFNYHYVTDKAAPAQDEELIILKTRASTRLEDMTAMALNNPQALANGEAVAIDPDNANIRPMIINDKTMVPIRFVSESLGAEVEWDDATQTALIRRLGRRVRFTVNSDMMQVEKNMVKLQTPAQLIDDRIFVPLRDAAEGLGVEVYWVDPGLIIVGEGANSVYDYSNVRSLLKGNFGI